MPVYPKGTPSSPLLTLSPPVEVVSVLAVLEDEVSSEVPVTTTTPVAVLEVVSEVSNVEEGATVVEGISEVEGASEVEGTGTMTTGAEELGAALDEVDGMALLLDGPELKLMGPLAPLPPWGPLAPLPPMGPLAPLPP